MRTDDDDYSVRTWSDTGLRSIRVVWPLNYPASTSNDGTSSNEFHSCSESNSVCTIVLEWIMNRYETIYNCGDFYLNNEMESSLGSVNASAKYTQRTTLADASRDGVSEKSCCYNVENDQISNAKEMSSEDWNGVELVPFGYPCGGKNKNSTRCGAGQCCVNLNNVTSVCAPAAMGSQGVYVCVVCSVFNCGSVQLYIHTVRCSMS